MWWCFPQLEKGVEPKEGSHTYMYIVLVSAHGDQKQQLLQVKLSEVTVLVFHEYRYNIHMHAVPFEGSNFSSSDD